MNVEIWSDFACPFCYMGKKRFEQALENFPGANDVTISFKSFELDPHYVVKEGSTIYDELSVKYGASLDDIKKSTNSTAAQAKELGLHYDFDALKLSNTLKAHQIALWATSKGYQEQITEALFKAHFEQGVDIGLDSELIKIVKALNLDTAEAQTVLDRGLFVDQIRQEEEEAMRLGVTGVPFFVIDGKYAINGAQSPHDMLDALNKIVAKN